MDAPRPGFPFRVFLPAIQLLLCIVVLHPYWFSLRAEVWRSIRGWEQSLFGNDESRPQPAIVLNVTPDLPPRQEPVDFHLTTPAALNLPIGLVQVPFVLASADNAEWAPDSMLPGEWRALSWPFLGIVFWWVAGRGVEAFFAAAHARRFAIIRPSLHWIEVAVGLALLVLGSVAGFMFVFGRNPLGLMTDWVFAAGGGLWAVLGAVLVAARLLQWRIRRLARLQGIAYVP